MRSGSAIEFYAKGTTTPCRKLTSPLWPGIRSGAFDVKGNFYITGPGRYTGQVGVVTGPGCAATTIDTLTLGNTLTLPVEIHLTPAGKIAVLDSGLPAGASAIYTYDPPVNGALGQPVATTSLDGLNQPTNFVFSQDAAFVYVADSFLGGIFTFAYPAGGTMVRSISAGRVDGITFSPPAHP